jgi:fused signal recognition particle receptor
MFSFFKKSSTKPAPGEDTPKPADPAESSPEADAALPASASEAPAEPRPGGWLARLRQGLAKTRAAIGGQLAGLFGRHSTIDENLYEELTDLLIAADVGVVASQKLVEDLRARARRDRLQEPAQLRSALKDALLALLEPLSVPLTVDDHKPCIIMFVGVNGSGKTTTIGKLAKHFQGQGRSVLLAAGDTFRAAAREQLLVWGERNNVTVITQEKGDSAAVIFDAINAAKARGIDVVLADTAGRLPTQLHLMEEIRKVKRVVAKADPSGPHEVLLVLDANTGQNAITQLQAFDDALGVTGLVVTKLDGTAKGGVVAAIAGTRPKPIRFIGVGETLSDLKPFSAPEFVDALIE